MEEKLIRNIIYSDEFEEYYASMNEQLKKKYDYALQIVKSQYVVSSKIVKSLEKTDFYELRISISSNEYRTILLAVDHDNFIQSKKCWLKKSVRNASTYLHSKRVRQICSSLRSCALPMLLAYAFLWCWDRLPF